MKITKKISLCLISSIALLWSAEAMAADVTAPTLSITAPKAGLLVSNANYVVTGKATDNVAVSNVWVQLDGGAWTPATTLIGSNWTAQVSLTPGTNTVAAFAEDTSGNFSPTNSVKFFYVVDQVLMVTTTGKGTFSPASYSNAVLDIGKDYTVKAAPATGFGFKNWTDGLGDILTNKETLVFLMSSNLTLTANFGDVTAPTLSITAPKAGLLVSNANYVVTGKATDNVAVSNVWVQLDGGAWTPATTLIGSNWTAQVSLTPGTNTVAAFAEDTSGNFSPTNSVKFFYVVDQVLMVTTTGKGTFSPASYSNAVLDIGKDYTVKAAPVTGFGFKNWTDGLGDILTNKETLVFLMSSNLTLTANFGDVTAPTLSITAPKAGLLVSNANYVVTGKATDNVAVSNVWVQLDGGAWTPATTLIGSNWTAQVSLTPGTNTVAAFAEDTSGNFSPTNSVKFFYVVDQVLMVTTTGKGTFSPASYSNAVLDIGKDYTVKAAPATGFGFKNWTDGLGDILTNKETLVFLMSSNLTLTANFGDVTAPTLSITAPKAGLLVSNANYVVTGKATDNVAVSNVWVQLDGGAWTPATTLIGSNWTAQVSLTPGTNTVAAFAEDTSGNFSPTNSVKFFYVVDQVLMVTTTGKGTFSPASYSNAVLDIGKDYTVKAAPATGFGFKNWTDGLGDILTNKETLVFLMSSNLTLTANFGDVTAPTLSITAPKAGLLVSNANYVVTGKATDNVAVSNVWVQLDGGAWTPATTLIGSNWTAQVSLTPGTNTVAAFAEDTSGNFSPTNSVKFFYVVDTRTIIGSWNLVQFMTPAQISGDLTNGLVGGNNFMATNGSLTFNTNGTLSGILGDAFTGAFTGPSNGVINAVLTNSEGTMPLTLFVNANKDNMTDVDSNDDTNNNFQEIVVGNRIPSALTTSEVVGTWNVVQFITPAQITGDPTNGPQGGLFFVETNGTLTFNANGTFSGVVGNPVSGSYDIVTNGAIILVFNPIGNPPLTFYINFNKNTMTETDGLNDNNYDFQEVNIALREPTSLKISDLAGSWNLVQFQTPARIFLATNELNGVNNFSATNGTLTVNSNGTINGTLGDDFTGKITLGGSGSIHASITSSGVTMPFTFFVNAGKDTMIEVEKELNATNNEQQIVIAHRIPAD